MKFKSTWFLALLAIALGFYVYFVEIKKAEKDEEKKAAAEKIFDFDYTKIKTVDLKNTHGEFKLEKEGDNWKLTSPVTDSADNSAVNGMLSGIANEKFEDTIEDENLKNFGLDHPTITVDLSFQDGNSKTLSIGADAALPGKLYLQRGGDKKILFATTSIKYQLDKEVKDLRDKRVFRKNKDDIQFISAKFNAKTLKGQIALSKKDKDWVIDGSDEVADSQTMTAFLNGIENLNATSFPSEKADAELKKYNLVNPALDLKLEGKDHALLAHILLSDKKDNVVFAKVDGSPTIYQLFGSAADNLMKGPSEFRNKTIPFQFKKEDVEDLYIKTSLPEVHLMKKGTHWELPLQDPQKQVSQIQVSNFLDKMAALKVAEYIKDEKPKGLNPPLGHVVLKNAKGDILLDFSWGERTKTPRNYFAKSNLYKGNFSVEGNSIDMLPNQTLVEKKPDPNATPAPTPKVENPSNLKPFGVKPQLPEGVLPHVKGP